METKNLKTWNSLYSTLVNRGINYVTVVSEADGNGGRRNKVVFRELSLSELDPFDYIEWEGTAKQAAANRNKLFADTYEPQYGDVREETYTLENLIAWA